MLLTRPPDLLLGLDPSVDRGDHRHVLRPGATVLLFTDGLVERRGASLDDGLEWLRATAADLGHLPLDELCDALLGDLDGRLDDDIALLAVRAHDESKPRPLEAGPERLPPGLEDTPS
jgi:serine phosphatase RsbU (regulator of sigma subunit)